MERVGCEQTIEALVALDAAEVPAKVDGLVDRFLGACSPPEALQRRAELARAFLGIAPFTELSYRIWRRIAGEEDLQRGEGQPPLRSPSMQFLPAVEFPPGHGSLPSG